MRKQKKDIEVLLLEYLLSGFIATHRTWGDKNGTSRLAVYVHRLRRKRFEIQTKIVYSRGDYFAAYYI